MQILQEIQHNLERNSIEPDEFTDRIIFMSTFNDKDQTKRGNDDHWVSNAEKVKDHVMILAQKMDVSGLWFGKDLDG